MKNTINNDYWLRRWREGTTGWHQDAPEPALICHFGSLQKTRILVPLCGKSLDLSWLASRGHEVIGVELSKLASESFFREQGLEFETKPAGAFTRYTSAKLPGLSILQGDFFGLTAKDVAPIGALYDRAALIAFPPELRTKYAAHITELVRSAAKPGFQLLELVIERSPHDEGGPPFSIPEGLLHSLYGRDFAIEHLEREDAEIERDDGARVDQCVYRLTPV